MAGEKLDLNNWLNKINDKITWFNADFLNLKDNVIQKKIDELQLDSLLGKWDKITDMKVPFLGSIAALTGFRFFNRERYKKWRLAKQMETRHKKSVNTTLSEAFTAQPERQTAMSTLVASYETIKTNAKKPGDSINEVCQLDLDPTKEQAAIDLLPDVNFSDLSKTIFDYVSKNEWYLDPTVLLELGGAGKITQDTVNTYVASRVAELAKTPWFMTDIKTPAHFTATIFLWLFVYGSAAADAFILGVKTPADFGAKAPEVVPPVTEVTPEKKQNVDKELTKYKSPLTTDMIIASAKKYSVPITMLMAFMKNDSAYGTTGLGANTHNPGNVWNTDGGGKKDRWTREAGVDAVGELLKWRIDEFKVVYGADKIPTAEQLAGNKWPDGKWFLSKQGNYRKDNPNKQWAYMSADSGPASVQHIQQDLEDEGLPKTA